MKKSISRPTLGDLKQHLTCSLCSGYLTEAATINKCLHSFCHPCIVRHLATSNSCPTCSRVLHTRRPLSKIRRDRTLQRLVYKTVPGLLKRTEVNENSKDLDPELSDPLFPCNDFFSICLEQKSRGSEIGPLTRIVDSLLSLVADDLKIEEPRYLFCAAIMKLKILKKFLSFKFDLSPRYEIGMMCCNELFDDDCTLLDVAYISRWTVAEPLKLQYLILDKEKLLATQDEESADPVLDFLPEDHPPPIEDLPPSVSGTSADLPISDIQTTPGPDEPLEGKSTIALPASSELETPVPSTPAEPRKAQSKSTAKKKRGRKPKSPEISKTISDETRLEKNNVESVDLSKPTPPTTNTGAPTVAADLKSAKKRGRKRKSDSVLFVGSADEKNDEFQSKKRSSRISVSCVEDTVSADIGNGNQDKPVTKKPKAVTPNDHPPSVPVSVVPEHKSSEEGDKQPAKAEQVSNSSENRIGTLKISLDGQHIVRNVTRPKDHADLKLNEEKKGHYDDNVTKGQYRLKRKDDLRVQLSRNIKPSRTQDEEDVSQEKPELTGNRKKTLRAQKKVTQLQQKTRKRVEASKIEVSDNLDRDFSIVTPRPYDKKCAKVVQKLSSPFDYDGSESEMYRRSSVIRKKRSPSITETPSPVVYDRDIETSPFLKRGNDKKVPRFLGRKSVLGKIPKAVSISTIPPTFVLAAERKQGNQNGDKRIDDREPVSLKVVLRMVDDRRLSVTHDRSDDCFMVSSTVADDEAELAGAGSGNSLDESPESGSCESRPALDQRTVSACPEPPRLQPAAVVSELSPFVHLVSDPRSKATPNKNLIANDALRPLPSVGSSAVELVQGSKPLGPSTGSVSSGKVDRGAKRKRLESVISSLKPVASVVVSTDPVKPPAPSSQPSIPNVATATTRDSNARSKFSPPVGFTQSQEKPKDTTPSLLHRLVSREPLNIPIPPMRHQWQPLRGAVYPPARFPPASPYPVRPQGQPRNTPRQPHPRAPRRAPMAQQVRAVRYPTASNAHIAAAAYAMGLLQAQRQTRPPSVYHRGWTPDQGPLRFFGGASEVRPGVVRTHPPPEPNGYDAPLELTTRKSRDVSA